MDLVWLFLLLVASGAVTGVVAGMLGVGGGIIVVPVLYYVFTLLGVDQSVLMHMAVGTSLATIIPTSMRSTLSHHRKGAVDWNVVRIWAPGIILGTICAAMIANSISSMMLTLIFASFAFLFALNMAFGREGWHVKESLPARGIQMVLAFFMGTLSALMGIGGGTLGVTLFTLFNMDIRRAVATAAGLGIVISIPGTLGFMIAGLGEEGRLPWSLGYINLLGFLCISVATVLTAPLGVHLAHTIRRTTLLRIFALFLIITSLRMFWSVIG